MLIQWPGKGLERERTKDGKFNIGGGKDGAGWLSGGGGGGSHRFDSEMSLIHPAPRQKKSAAKKIAQEWGLEGHLSNYFELEFRRIT